MVAKKENMDDDLNMAAICLYLFHGRLWYLVDYDSSLQIWSIVRGSINPLPLMSKGENDIEDLEVAIKSKGGDCWHYDSGLALWYRCCT